MLLSVKLPAPIFFIFGVNFVRDQETNMSPVEKSTQICEFLISVASPADKSEVRRAVQHPEITVSSLNWEFLNRI